MIIPCEVAVKCLLPPVRALLSKTLATKHKLTQIEVAKLLGASQPAVSLYDKKMRGKALNLENEKEIIKLIENLADMLANGNLQHKDFIQAFCEICKKIRAKGLFCQLHKTFDPTIELEKCELCLKTSISECI